VAIAKGDNEHFLFDCTTLGWSVQELTGDGENYRRDGKIEGGGVKW